MSKKSSIFLFAMVVVVLVSLGIYWFFSINKSNSENKDKEAVAPTTTLRESSQADLPENFPKFPNADLTDSWSSDTRDTRGSSFVMITDETKTDVFDFYKSQLPIHGWSIQNENIDNFVMNIASENIQGFLVISDNDAGETLISVTFAIIKND